ncbi:MAG: hypothetical protein KDA21_04710 [Phycisphaerales bacterium]|nr:hypothetical protein [Phycisphaerales bacterium]
MQRPGANHEDMQVSDFLCDFCRRAWDGAFPLVEGHQGSLICGDCLAIAWTEIELLGQNLAAAGTTCTMCLEEHERRAWVSPAYDDATICHRCIKQGAGRLHKDPDWDWSKPTLKP